MQLKASAAAPLAAALALPLAPAQADTAPEDGRISFKLLDYRERQPGADRVQVQAPALSVLVPLGSRWSTTATLVYDTISGASPAYHSTALTPLKDLRRALDVSISRYFDDATLTLGAGRSVESDYRSTVALVQLGVSSADRNTTWTAGVAGTADRIDAGSGAIADPRKRSASALVGLTRVLSAHDVVQLNLGAVRLRGYLSDPYKVFDARPRARDQHTLMLRWNHHLESIGGTLRTSWRAFSDTWGVRAYTLAAEFQQPLGAGWSLTPILRLHDQSAARFYVDADPSTEPFAPNPPADAVFFSEDQRLSAFGARTLGLKLAWQLDTDWTADIKLEHYAQRGSWRWLGTGSPGLASFSARSVQFGLARRF